jgi:ribose-phosphate pyrophosphokinase
MPYYGYSRQDRKDQPRVAIAAKLMANMIQAAGADRLLGIDFHQHQLQGFFDIPVDHLYAAPVFVSHYRRKTLRDLTVVGAGRGRGEDGARLREAPRRVVRDPRQAPPARERRRGAQRRGRGRRPRLPPGGRHDRHRRAR